MTQTLSIALLQCNPLCGAIADNTAMLLTHIKHHESLGTDLLCTPELMLCGYPPEDLLLRPAFHSTIKRAIHTLCEQVSGDMALLVSYPHYDKSGITNRAALIQHGQIQLTYDKQFLPNTDTFDEKRYFKPGNKPASFDLKGHRIGLLICEDVWSDDIVNKTTSLDTELLIILNASPYAIGKQKERMDRLSYIAKEHHQTCCYLNLVGGQDELVFDGRSLIINADGSLQKEGKAFSEDTLLLAYKSNASLSYQQESVNPDATLYQALVFGVREYIRKNHFPGALIGLSGGVDSALTLAIAVDALGADKVHAVMMPTRYTSQESLEDAKRNAELLKVNYSVIDIEPMFQSMTSTLLPHFNKKAPDTTEENIQARLRSIILMGLSNKHGNIVLCTGNKSEMAVGYSTLYGDLAGGFSPLKDVFKTTVYRLCEYRNSLSDAIPPRVISKAPSAELAENQRDDDSLPPYPILDAILKHSIHQELSPKDLKALGFDAHDIDNVLSRISRNEYKRRQAPIGIRVSSYAFGKDRRYPITRWKPKDIFDDY